MDILHNQIHIFGRLGSDVEYKMTDTWKMAKFSLATSHGVKKDGEWENVTSWFNCVAWGDACFFIKDMIKGQYIALHGEIRREKWEKDGKSGTNTTVLVKTAYEMPDPFKKNKERDDNTAF